MSTYKNPNWWTPEHDSAWSRVKEAIKRDWDQTAHDMGGKKPDTNQKIGNTVRQASGSEIIPPRDEPAYDKVEPAYRYGYVAHSKYGDEFSDWNEAESHLKSEWEELEPSHQQTWMQDRAAIRYGWEFEP